MAYEVTILTVRPGTQGQALARLKDWDFKNELLACWYSELGALNRIMLVRQANDPVQTVRARDAMLKSGKVFGLNDLITSVSMDFYSPIAEEQELPDLPPLRPGQFGPIFEVRSYIMKLDGLAPTIAIWKKSVPGRARISPVLAALYSVGGPLIRFVHIWPYPGLDERARLRAKSIAEGVWPPPGGPDHFESQQSDIYLPAAFSPIK